MALAIEFDGMLCEVVVTGYADLARPGLVVRARITRILNLLNLAADIQTAILFLPERPLPEAAYYGHCGGTGDRVSPVARGDHEDCESLI